MTAGLRRLRDLAAGLAALLFASHALAAASGPGVAIPSAVARTVSYSAWTVNGAGVRLLYTLPHDARRILAAKGARPLDITDIGQAVLQGVGVSSRGGDCEAIDQGEGVGQVYPLALDPTVDRFEIIFQCPDSQGVALHDHLLFDKVRDHIDFAQVTAGGRTRLETFSHDHQDVPARASSALSDPTTSAVTLHGGSGLFQDPLRLCALLAVLLTLGRWPSAPKIGAAAVAGYVIAFAASASGLETPDIRLDRALEGLMTVVVALGVVLAHSEGGFAARSWKAVCIAVAAVLAVGALALAVPHGAAAVLAVAGMAIAVLAQVIAAPNGGWRTWLQLAFVGFLAALDGLTQATLLSPLKAPLGVAAPVLAEMSVGAAVAICLTLAAVEAARWMLRGRLMPLRVTASELVAACVAGAGLFWFASQLYSV
jgi:hypothetical protein